jgi:S1-C subfamily serine protease
MHGMTEPDGSPPADSTADDASGYSRPSGVAGGFAPHPPLPPTAPARRPEPAGARELFGRPGESPEPFAPAIGERIQPRHQAAPPPVHPALADAFGRTAGPDESFDAPPGARLTAGRSEPPRFWKDDAERDPWRDPASPYWLGRPALFVADRPLAMGEDEPLPEAEPEPDDDGDEPTGGGRYTRIGPKLFALILLAALIAGGAGGGIGYWISSTSSQSLRDPDFKLAKTTTPANRPTGSVAEIAQRVGPAVVEIVVTGSTESGTGSGVVIDKSGYIVTNNHVVSVAADGGSIRVVFSDESIATAKLVGTDPVTDLAVIKVDHSPLTVATLGDSSKIAVGDPVIAIGSPLGLQGTVTTGIVSALDRAVHVSGEGSTTDAVIDAIQTDAAINPGNSGGALVNADGSVIGIPSAIASLGSSSGGQTGSIGLGFAIPINVASDIATQLIQHGKAVHATLGVSSRSVTDGTRFGAYLVQVTPNGPAAKAGLKEGDVIKLMDSTLIGSSEDLSVAISKHKPNEVVTIRYDRGGKEQDVKVTLGSDS